jgi:hypothetical protein
MKIVIEIRGGLVSNVITTDKADIAIIDYDNIENAEKQKDIEDTFYSYANESIMAENELNTYLISNKDLAIDDFNSMKIDNNKKLKSTGDVACGKCDLTYDSRYLFSLCPECGYKNLNCTLCSMDNCAKCSENGSMFDGFN